MVPSIWIWQTPEPWPAGRYDRSSRRATVIVDAALERSIAGDLRHKLAATTQTLTEDRRGGKVTL
jgi:hypothetical protein